MKLLRKTELLLTLFGILIFCSNINAGNVYSGGSGNWSTLSWKTSCGGGASAAPGAGDNVFICSGHTVTLNASTSITSLTVNSGGTLTISGAGAGGYDLTLSGNLTVDGTINFSTTGAADKTIILGAGKTITIGTTGSLDMTTGEADVTIGAGSFFTINGAGTFIWNPNTNTSGGATIFTNTTESFSSTSNITILNWYDATVPLQTNVSGTFGNLTIDAPLTWDQDGAFGGASQKILGTFTLGANSSVIMDGGTGGTTQLILGNIVDNSTNGFTIASGANRNLTLTTGSVTQASGTLLFSIMDQTHGNLNWTANGDVHISADFTAIQGGVIPAVSSSTITINGNLTVDGSSLFDINRGLQGTNSPATITITGAASISTTGWFRCIDDGNGALSFSANSLDLSNASNTANFKFSASGATVTGNVTINITNNMSVSTGADVFILGDAAGAFGAPLTSLNGNTCTVSVGGTLSTDNSSSNSLYITKTSGTAGNSSLTANAINFQGGTFIVDGSWHSAGGCTINITNGFTSNFSNTTDQVILVNVISDAATVPNAASLSLTIGGDLTLSGDATGSTFRGSAATGGSTVTIGGSMSVGGGYKSRFVSGTNGHNLSLTIGGSLAVSAGSFWCNYRPGVITATVGGSMTVTGGSFAISSESATSTSTFAIGGNYSQNNGTFSLHDDDVKGVTISNPVTVTLTGTFSMTNGNLIFDTNQSSTGVHKFYLNGSSFTFGGSALIKRDDPSASDVGTAGNTVHGEFYYNRAGTITYSRTSTTCLFGQVRQIISSGCIVDASASANYLQISAHDDAENSIPASFALLDISGTLNMGSVLIRSKSFSTTAEYFTSISVKSGGVLQTANVNGFYNGTLNSATVQPYGLQSDDGSANTNNKVNWDLNANSTIEYNGTASQVVTGKFPANFTSNTNSDIATGTNSVYKYGILKINNSVSPAAGRCYMAASNVYVRTLLDLTLGEFAMGTNANPVGTGYTLTVENGANTAITSTASSYLASEQNLDVNAAVLDWQNIGASTSTYTFPFGRYTTAIKKLPFTIAKGAGDNFTSLKVSTRRTATSNNMPWGGVSNVAVVGTMADVTAGVTDGSDCCVIDRWWDIKINNAAAMTTLAGTATLGFSYLGEENTMTGGATLEIGIQHWNGTKWDDGTATTNNGLATGTGTNGIQTTGTVQSVSAAGFKVFSPYVLVIKTKPLPVELMNFTGECKKNEVNLSWSTASEKNNDYFMIEKSGDGKTYTEIGKVKGIVNSSQTHNYSFKDNSPLKGTSYYRLKQTDLDGKFTYSDPIEVKACGLSANATVFVSPVPAKESVIIRVDTDMDQMVSLKIYDARGRLVAIKDVALTKGSNYLEQTIHDFEAGVYIINIPMQENVLTTRFIKQH